MNCLAQVFEEKINNRPVVAFALNAGRGWQSESGDWQIEFRFDIRRVLKTRLNCGSRIAQVSIICTGKQQHALVLQSRCHLTDSGILIMAQEIDFGSEARE